ncbi:DUF397 domain-containing protein [Spirillospora sp. NPDC047418]
MTKKFTDWRVSSYSEAGGNYVEAGRSASGTISVRDTKARGAGPVLEFSRLEWSALLDSIRAN